MRLGVLTILIIFATGSSASAQQWVDSTFTITVQNPAFESESGPLILIDAFHNNDMSMHQRMDPFLKVLRKDGFRLRSGTRAFHHTDLHEIDIIVIIGALHERNRDNWTLPTPEALRDEETDALLSWVDAGGSLLLVADHMPFPGAIQDFTKRLGVEWHNGFVIDSVNWGMSVFSRSKGTLKPHRIIDGRYPKEQIQSVASYYGSGFQIKNDSIIPLFAFDNPNEVSYQTAEAWKMDKNTPVRPTSDMYQGAVMRRGKGRIALMGEASLFSAQRVGRNANPVGINVFGPHQNLQFVLNLFHWLSGLLD